MATPVEKFCSGCQQAKPLSEFHKNRRMKDGLANWCKTCISGAQKRWEAANRERRRVLSRAWYAANRDRKQALGRQWDLTHGAWRKNYGRRWAESHRASKKAAAAKRRTHVRGGGGGYTAIELRHLYAQYDHRCLACGRKLKLEADHIVPVSKGGDSNITNIQPLCTSCNRRKAIKTIDFRQEWSSFVATINYPVPLPTLELGDELARLVPNNRKLAQTP